MKFNLASASFFFSFHFQPDHFVSIKAQTNKFSVGKVNKKIPFLSLLGVLHKLRIILNEDSLIQFLNHTSKRYNSLSTKLTTMKTNHTIDNLPKNILEFFPLVFTSPEGKQFAICVSWENLLLAIHQRR